MMTDSDATVRLGLKKQIKENDNLHGRNINGTNDKIGQYNKWTFQLETLNTVKQ